MSYVAKGEKEYDATGAPVPGAKIHKIRITLTSRNVKNLEKCACSGLRLFLVAYGNSTTLCSLERPHQPGQGQAALRQGPCPSPDQDPQDHHPQVGAWFRLIFNR
jgi:hypothetical protein